jgi:hypothetical protein
VDKGVELADDIESQVRLFHVIILTECMNSVNSRLFDESPTLSGTIKHTVPDRVDFPPRERMRL